MKATTDIKQFFTPEQLSCMARKKKEKWKRLEDREAAIWAGHRLEDYMFEHCRQQLMSASDPVLTYAGNIWRNKIDRAANNQYLGFK